MCCVCGLLVKWLRRRPLTAKTGVRLSYGSPAQRSPAAAGLLFLFSCPCAACLPYARLFYCCRKSARINDEGLKNRRFRADFAAVCGKALAPAGQRNVCAWLRNFGRAGLRSAAAQGLRGNLTNKKTEKAPRKFRAEAPDGKSCEEDACAYTKTQKTVRKKPSHTS